MWKCKSDFLWFKEGQVVKDIQDNWKPFFNDMSIEIPETVLVSEPVTDIVTEDDTKPRLFGLGKRGRPKRNK